VDLGKAQTVTNLKRTHSSIKDVHSNLILSTAVKGFTVITIVFAPLAFLTALFALEIEEFGRLQIVGGGEVYDSGKLGGIFGGRRAQNSTCVWETDQPQSVPKF
jgi:hypothetical protein